MTRYLIFGSLGLLLNYPILMTVTDHSILVDIMGLFVFSIGANLYLNDSPFALLSPLEK